jgi:hypothetical protein
LPDDFSAHKWAKATEKIGVITLKQKPGQPESCMLVKQEYSSEKPGEVGCLTKVAVFIKKEELWQKEKQNSSLHQPRAL